MTELRLGYESRDESAQRCGYDIESRVLDTGTLRFKEVKGRQASGKTITVEKNETLTALNRPEDFLLAIVQVDGDRVAEPQYLACPVKRQPAFGVSVTSAAPELLARARSVLATKTALDT